MGNSVGIVVSSVCVNSLRSRSVCFSVYEYLIHVSLLGLNLNDPSSESVQCVCGSLFSHYLCTYCFHIQFIYYELVRDTRYMYARP